MASVLAIASLTGRAYAESADAPVVFLIPGAASSGDQHWIDNLHWSLRVLVGDSVRWHLPELRAIRTGYSADVFKAQDTPDNPDIRYYSFTNSASEPALKFFYSSKEIIESQLKELRLDPSVTGSYGTKNDGVVPGLHSPKSIRSNL